MTTTINPGALRLARAAVAQLNVQEKALLLSELAQAVAAAVTTPVAAAPAADSAHGFRQLRAVAADIHTAYPHADVGARLDADRRERDAAVTGEARDVHA